MRVSGGNASGRRLLGPEGKTQNIRPSSDRVREALFQLIDPRQIIQSRVLDLFAGTGALGIEALSRGAAFVLFVDHSLAAGRLIEANLRACFSRPAAAFLCQNLTKKDALNMRKAGSLAQEPFDLIFMDPPYQKRLAKPLLMMLETSTLLKSDALLVVEEHRDADLPLHSKSLALIDHRRYGETGLWFYRPRQA